jgi:outer membrane receptor protein involved in Fe transport
MLKEKISRTALLTILATIVAATAWAQRGTIRGTVLDAVSATPLAGTTIIIEGPTIGTVADAEGGFVISNIAPGRVTITTNYLGYEVFRETVTVEADRVITMRIPLHAQGINLEDVVVIARIDNEAESVVLSGQRESLAAIQAVGAAEMSRKGIGNARAAVAQVSGISQQEGVKNVFVRGLGDRYNATFLNGFPLPGEDPEYKNIALEFFGSDIIQTIGVNKVFGAANNGDVGGAVIDIRSKELSGDRALSIDLDGGFNGAAIGNRAGFLRQEGVGYFGVSRTAQPTEGRFDFANKLDPASVKMPANHSYGISGGKRWLLGKRQNPLSFFVVGSHSTDYSFTDETVRKGTADGENVSLDQTGQKSSIGINQLVLGNARMKIDRRHDFAYNFMMVHANDQYVGRYQGYYYEVNQGTENGEACLLRQQSNDNLLIAHQLTARLSLSERWRLDLGGACNTVTGLEPDRRENVLIRLDDGRYHLAGGDRQRRFFSRLDDRDLNLKASIGFQIKRGVDFDKSNVTLGYRGRMVDDGFRATEYNIRATSGFFSSIDDIHLDDVYNEENYDAGRFSMRKGRENRYDVSKTIHSAYIEATHRFTERFAASIGFQVDKTDMTVDYDVDAHPPGMEKIDKFYYLPSVSLRYDLTDEHSLRLGVSKSYTLPQSKEIAPYQYVNIGFTSEGSPYLKPSDNHNVDLKWDWYPSSSELLSLGVFYKHILNPIGRVDVGGSAGLLSYENISKKADVAGVEFEIRKNIRNTTTIRRNMRRLSVGANASYIYSDLEFDALNTELRRTELEGASPFLVNGDVSYNWSSSEKAFNVSIVAGWFSDRIHTIGTRNYKDTIEEGVVTLSVVSSYRFNKYVTLKLKAGNLLDPAHRLTRAYVTTPGKMILSESRKGVDVSVGVSFDIW